MDKEYLENYLSRENEEYERLVIRKIDDGSFDFESDKYPSDSRFIKLQRPVTDITSIGCYAEDHWNQVPFSGSTIFYLDALPPATFEQFYFKISEIPKVIDFIKETGKIQIALRQPPTIYEGLNYLDPFFKELEPPFLRGISFASIVPEKELKFGVDSFNLLSQTKFLDFYSEIADFEIGKRNFTIPSLVHVFRDYSILYALLKIRYPLIAKEVEDALIDNPLKVLSILNAGANFVVDPLINIRFDSLTHSFEEVRQGKKIIGQAVDFHEIRFPCEVGKFLLKKLTYAPNGLRACNELIDHYSSYDLQKVHSSLNEAIIKNHPDIVEKTLAAFSDILDNVWNDKTIPRRIKGLKIGLPFSLAAIGDIVAGPLGGIGGLLAGLGFDVANRVLEVNTEGLDEKISKMFSRSYQIDIYDFKKKYKGRIVA